MLNTTENKESNDDGSDEETEDSCLSPFESLPVEMFLHICSFLDVKDIIFSLEKVCKKFYQIINCTWKSYVNKRWPDQHPIVQIASPEEVPWKYCAFYLDHDELTYDKHIYECVEKRVHFSNVDDLIILERGSRVLSASRDHTIAAWAIYPDAPESGKLVNIQQIDAHKGWVWRLRQLKGDIYSASFDGFLKQWDLGAEMVEVQSFPCGVSAQCMTEYNGLIYVGTRKTILAFDPRSGIKPVNRYEAHRGAVLTIDCLKSDIVSLGEDRSILVWDARSARVKERVNLAEENTSPTCCSYVKDDVLYLGTKRGSVLLYAFKNGSLSHAYTIPEERHARGITALHVQRGSFLTGSEDGTVLIKSALTPPNDVFVFDCTRVVSAANYGYGFCVLGTNDSVMLIADDN